MSSNSICSRILVFIASNNIPQNNKTNVDEKPAAPIPPVAPSSSFFDPTTAATTTIIEKLEIPQQQKPSNDKSTIDEKLPKFEDKSLFSSTTNKTMREEKNDSSKGRGVSGLVNTPLQSTTKLPEPNNNHDQKEEQPIQQNSKKEKEDVDNKEEETAKEKNDETKKVEIPPPAPPPQQQQQRKKQSVVLSFSPPRKSKSSSNEKEEKQQQRENDSNKPQPKVVSKKNNINTDVNDDDDLQQQNPLNPPTTTTSTTTSTRTTTATKPPSNKKIIRDEKMMNTKQPPSATDRGDHHQSEEECHRRLADEAMMEQLVREGSLHNITRKKDVSETNTIQPTGYDGRYYSFYQIFSSTNNNHSYLHRFLMLLFNIALFVSNNFWYMMIGLVIFGCCWQWMNVKREGEYLYSNQWAEDQRRKYEQQLFEEEEEWRR